MPNAQEVKDEIDKNQVLYLGGMRESASKKLLKDIVDAGSGGGGSSTLQQAFDASVVATGDGDITTGSNRGTGYLKINGGLLDFDPANSNTLVNAGNSNTGSGVTALGQGAGYGNTGSDVTALGSAAGYGNTGSGVTALGQGAGNSNTGSDVTALGVNAGLNNTGSGVTALGQGAGNSNTGSDVTALGSAAGYGNTQSNRVILSYASLPQFANAAAAAAAMPTAGANGVYIYWNLSNDTIMVRP